MDGLHYLPIKINIIDVGTRMNVENLFLLSNNTINHVDKLDFGHSQDARNFLLFFYNN